MKHIGFKHQRENYGSVLGTCKKKKYLAVATYHLAVATYYLEAASYYLAVATYHLAAASYI
jgi:hypothetical protein